MSNYVYIYKLNMKESGIVGKEMDFDLPTLFSIRNVLQFALPGNLGPGASLGIAACRVGAQSKGLGCSVGFNNVMLLRGLVAGNE